MTRLIVAFAVTGVVFCIGDFLWLGIVAKDFYQAQIGALLLTRPDMTVGAIFYLLYVLGIVIFAIAPALGTGSCLKAAVSGALFGLFAYATYDLSNLATLIGWSVRLTLVDMAWGTFMTGVAAAIGCRASAALLR
jgi:uncharacterized membrane protein